MSKFKVQVIRDDSQKVVHEIECKSNESANRVAIGLSINLNRDEYSVVVTKEKENQ